MADSDCKTLQMEDTKHCTPCKTKDKETKPEYYCMDCEAYYCEECFELHLRVPYLAKHIVLKHDDIDLWSRDQYKCSTHGKNFEFFCKEHKMLCCHVCISLSHRSCTNMGYIQEEAMKICIEDDKETIRKQTEEQLQSLESSYVKIKQKTETNKTSKIEYIKELESFRSRMNAMFDSLVEKEFKKMNEKYDTNTKYSEKVTKRLVCFEGRLKSLQQQLKSTTVGKEALIYISLQRSEELIEEMSNELSKIDFSVGKEKYKPIIDGAIEKYVEELVQIAVLKDEKMKEEYVASDTYTEEIKEFKTIKNRSREKRKCILAHLRDQYKKKEQSGGAKKNSIIEKRRLSLDSQVDKIEKRRLALDSQVDTKIEKRRLSFDSLVDAKKNEQTSSYKSPRDKNEQTSSYKSHRDKNEQTSSYKSHREEDDSRDGYRKSDHRHPLYYHFASMKAEEAFGIDRHNAWPTNKMRNTRKRTYISSHHRRKDESSFFNLNLLLDKEPTRSDSRSQCEENPSRSRYPYEHMERQESELEDLEI